MTQIRKRAYITGASSGFGEAIARVLASDGVELILLARRLCRLEKLQAEFSHKTTVYCQEMDVTALDNTRSSLTALVESYGAPTILINNAGLALGLEPAHKTNFADWQRMIDTNVTGLANVTHTLLPFMVQQGCGHIINIGSTAGNWPYKGGNVYGASKAFVKNLSQQLRCDLVGTGIRVTNLEPGLAETEFSVIRFKGDTEAAGKVYEDVKPLRAEDIANIVHWLVNTPAHVNVNQLEVMPVCQSVAGMNIHR